jgi:hypothetical protein
VSGRTTSTCCLLACLPACLPACLSRHHLSTSLPSKLSAHTNLYMPACHGLNAKALRDDRAVHMLSAVTRPSTQRDDVCADAVAAARRSLSDEAQALSAARMLSRALALRQLLGEALNAALGAALPIVSATLDAVPGNVGLAVPQPPLRTTGRGMEAPERWLGRSSVLGDRHVCDVFGLPRPGLQGDASPVVADPLLVDALVGVCACVLVLLLHIFL